MLCVWYQRTRNKTIIHTHTLVELCGVVLVILVRASWKWAGRYNRTLVRPTDGWLFPYICLQSLPTYCLTCLVCSCVQFANRWHNSRCLSWNFAILSLITIIYGELGADLIWWWSFSMSVYTLIVLKKIPCFFQISIYAGYAVMAFLASFVISIAFEAPAVRILKIISGGTRKNYQWHHQSARISVQGSKISRNFQFCNKS